MKILVTGCAGFIGFHISNKLLAETKYTVIGIDNLNNYYDNKLKKDRLKIISNYKNFKFIKTDICNKKKIENVFKKYNFEVVIHLAAQAGVRHSISHPDEYISNNINGFYNVLDCSKKIKVKHFLYASTSSIYGNSKKFPLKEKDETSRPLSLYAATKKSNEVLAYSYSNIFLLPTTGMRFFTVYGEWGRPDMALFKFTASIVNNKKIELFGYGKHERDFTHVDDITSFIFKIINKPSKKNIPYQIFNFSSNKPKTLKYFLKTIEKNLKKESNIKKNIFTTR